MSQAPLESEPDRALKVGLFVPCYVDQFYPEVAVAALELLEKTGCRVEYPLDQTCCGQPLANAGFEAASTAAMRHFVALFEAFDYVVAPSGSCVLHVRERFSRLEQTESVRRVRDRTKELCEFLTDVVGFEARGVSYPRRVALHAGCHGLRGLRLAASSDMAVEPFDRVRRLLSGIADIEIVEPRRPQECCGFGGTFAVTEPAVSTRMGRDRLDDYVESGAEVLAGTDVSCLMHLDGLARRERRPLEIMHVARILNGSAP